MTALEPAALRQLSRQVLARRAGPAASSKGLAAATLSAYEDLARVSAPLIGQVGVDALAGRAVHLAQREYPWLAPPTPERAPEPFAEVMVWLERQNPAVATDAAGAVLTAFIGLLVTFIGEPITARLLRDAWPDTFSDAYTAET